MIIKRRSESLMTIKLDAIISRLPVHHEKLAALKKDAALYAIGYRGERRIDYFLASLPDEYAVLNDVTLKHKNQTIQIDSLVITDAAIFIIEVKNFSSTLTFNTTLRQLTQDDGQQTRGLQYPITQVENTHMNLMYWLQARNLTGLPIHHFVVIAFSNTIFHVVGNEAEIAQLVTYADNTPSKITQLNNQLQNANNANKQLKNRIISTIMNELQDFDIDFFQKYGLTPADILPGVHCPSCAILGIKRIHGKWLCQHCQKTSVHAHIKAIDDYILLINNDITNRELRRFLLLKSRQTAYRLMKKYNALQPR